MKLENFTIPAEAVDIPWALWIYFYQVQLHQAIVNLGWLKN
jgi:hypothetical protein